MKPKTLQVEVTTEHIAMGKKRNNRQCPIAKALRSLGYRNVTVCKDFEPVCLIGKEREFRLPAIAQRFVEKFDLGKPVKPLTFKMREIIIEESA